MPAETHQLGRDFDAQSVLELRMVLLGDSVHAGAMTLRAAASAVPRLLQTSRDDVD